MSSSTTERPTIPTRVATVAAVDDIGDGLRQISFGGMRDHEPIGPDDFFLVIRPKPGQEHILDGGTDFGALRALPEDRWPDWAYYTCRRWRPDAGELDAWFVLHEHDGPISGWARRAAVGDRVLLWGPRAAFEPPPDTTRLLLVGDETGLGAFSAILESTPPAIELTVLVESDDGRPTIELPTHPNATVRWVGRAGAERGTGKHLAYNDVIGPYLQMGAYRGSGGAAIPETMATRIRDLEVTADGLYAYGAGESRLMTAVRAHLQDDRGVPHDQVRMVAYWRRAE